MISTQFHVNKKKVKDANNMNGAAQKFNPH